MTYSIGLRKKMLVLAFPLMLIAALVLPMQASYAANLQLKPVATAVGKVIMTTNGRAVYFYDRDKPGTRGSACTAQCAQIWPPVLVAKNFKTTISPKAHFATIKIGPGKLQLTINSRPVYYYAYDTTPYAISGQGSQGIWYLVQSSGVEDKVVK